MSKKVKVTKRQLDLIANHINESKRPSNLIKEELKDVVLGVALLMGVGLSGQNKAIAQDALNDVNVLKKISSTVSTPSIEKIAEKMEEMGMQNAMQVIQNNAKSISDLYAYYANKKEMNPNLTVYNDDVE